MNEALVREVIAELRTRTVEYLPHDWQKGLKCPECGGEADRPKCFYDYGGGCPRHDPDNYTPSPYRTRPDPDAQRLANTLQEALK